MPMIVAENEPFGACPPDDGILWLGVNDQPEWFHDNMDYFFVTIQK
jgi:hypothetical protein